MPEVPTREEFDELAEEVRALRVSVDRLENPPEEIERVEVRLTKAEVRAILEAPQVIEPVRMVGDAESPRSTAFKALRAALED